MEGLSKPVFVGFVPEDEDFVVDLARRLTGRFPELTVQSTPIAPMNIPGPETVPDSYWVSVFIAVLSPACLGSAFAQDQLAEVTRSALQGRLRLIPVMHKPCSPPGLIGTLEPVDFSNDSQFHDAFEQLCEGISAEHEHGPQPGSIRANVSTKELLSALIRNEMIPRIERVELPPNRSNAQRSASALMGEVFLSYPSCDREFVARLSKELSKRMPEMSLRDRLLLPPQPAFAEIVMREFGDGDVFLAVLSTEYLNDPQRQNELCQATQQALYGRGRLVPIIRRPCSPDGFLGMLEAADFTDEAKTAASIDGLAAGILGTETDQPEPGDLKLGLTMNDIGKAVDEISRISRRRTLEELYLRDLTTDERKAVRDDVAEEIKSAINEICSGAYDRKLRENGVEVAKEDLPEDFPLEYPRGRARAHGPRGSCDHAGSEGRH